jgi:hypothetical protein
MNVIDATALPMFNCFNATIDSSTYKIVENRIPLDEMNKRVVTLTGRAKKYALLSATPQYDNIDSGNDDLLNHILWFATKGNTPYPKQMTIPLKDREEDDDD